VAWPDGSLHWMWCSGALRADAPRWLDGAVTEITDTYHVAAMARVALTEREREIERLSRLYAALSHINQVIARTTTRDELLRKICRALVEHGGFRMSWIGWYAPDSHAIVPAAVWGDETGYLDTTAVYGDERPEGHGPTGTAFREGRPYISNHLLQDPASAPWRDALVRAGFRGSAAFPVREAGQLRGTLTVYAGEPGMFRESEIALLAEAANDLSFGLDNLARDAARRRAEDTVRSERDFSDAVLNSLPGVLYMYDREGQFIRWNQNFECVTGYSAAEIASLHPLALFPDADKPVVAARIEDVFRAGESSIEASFLARDGTTTPYHFTGVRTILEGRACLIGVGIDVSARQRAEAARRASEARYRTLFDHAPDGILIADPQGRYLDANPSVCRMLGHARDELIGLHASDIVAQAELPHIPDAQGDILAAADHHREWALRRKDGSVFPAEVTAIVMPDGNLLAVLRDASARQKAEAALRELNESLEHKVAVRTGELQRALVRAESADRLKSAFLATMSHELRTPLNSIIGFTGIVLNGMAGPITPEQTKQLGMVRGSARHLLELINDVLDLSKIEAEQLELHPARFDLRASVTRVIGTVTPLAEAKGLTLAAVVAPAVGELVSDRRRVEQILLNLLNNAIKFTEHGSVTLSVEACEASPAIEGAGVRLRVTDTGIGITEADLATLFEPFRQLDTGLTRRHEGTGLGLAICRRLARLLGGEITVTSHWGNGSEFTVTLPVTRREGP